MSKPPTILFVSHMANRSGAPLLLLEVIRAYRRTTGLPVKILVMRNGPLVDAFKSEGPTYVWENPVHPGRLRATQFLARLFQSARTRIILNKLRPLSVVFLNTYTLGLIQKRLLPDHPRFITYVHELEAGIHFNTDPESRQAVAQHTSVFLAGSHAVKENLVRNQGISEDKIRVFHSTVPEMTIDRTIHKDFQIAFRKARQIPDDAVIAGIVAEREWRKGSDLFLPLITVLNSLNPSSRLHFLWIGHRPQEIADYQFQHDLNQVSWGNKVHLIPHGPDFMKFMSLLDLHVMLSREDPYPLVMLNAASFGTPTICFEGSGGPAEFVGSDAGVAAPYGDILAMAKILDELTEDVERRQELGRGAHRKLTGHHDADSIMSGIIQEIKSIM